jgi:hypothetical protein
MLKADEIRADVKLYLWFHFMYLLTINTVKYLRWLLGLYPRSVYYRVSNIANRHQMAVVKLTNPHMYERPRNLNGVNITLITVVVIFGKHPELL